MYTHLSRVVKTLVTDSPLTSVSFMEDGVTIAVGSSNGKIMIYDLRSSATNQATNTSSPIFSFAAHSPNSINALQFQNSERLKVLLSFVLFYLFFCSQKSLLKMKT